MEMASKTIGGYTLLEEIGRGGVATVFRAVAQDGAEVAVKVHNPLLISDPQMASRFVREVRVLRTLQHPNIVPILDFGEENGYAYIVMPYLKDGTLQDRLKAGALRPKEGARVIGQVASALDYAHKQGVVHRDVKPSNVLLDSEGNALLSDFGFAHISDASVSLTGSALIGTPAYMSPEQCRGAPVDPRSDLYSLGVILYQITTGHLPYEADTPMAVVIKQVNEPLPNPRDVCPNLPESVEDVLLRSLEKDPADRYGSAAELNRAFQIALKEALSGKPTSTWRRRKTRTSRRPSRNLAGAPRRPSRRSAAALGVLVGILTHFLGGYGLEAFANVMAAQAGGQSVADAPPDLSATVSVLLTANAPASGTETFPGQVATSVAATLTALLRPTEGGALASGTVTPRPSSTVPSGTGGGAPPPTGTPPPQPTSFQGSNPWANPTSVPSAYPSATLRPSATVTRPPGSGSPTSTQAWNPTRTPTFAPNATNTPHPSPTPSSTKTFAVTPTATKTPPPTGTNYPYPTSTSISIPSLTAYPTYNVTPTDSTGSSSGDGSAIVASPTPPAP
jgi:serine/threonine protein kinase